MRDKKLILDSLIIRACDTGHKSNTDYILIKSLASMILSVRDTINLTPNYSPAIQILTYSSPQACCSSDFIDVISIRIATRETQALAIKAVGAPNWFQINPNNNDAGKTVIPNARLYNP